MTQEERLQKAIELFREAYRRQMEGDLEGAIEHYQRSIALQPTAEAHTFLGWTYSFQGRLEEAIAECKEAIAVDPDFGNPYNDIGSYLIKLERPDEAIPWLEAAIKAARYDPRHYPHCNLGQIYWAKGLLAKAREEFERALELALGATAVGAASHREAPLMALDPAADLTDVYAFVSYDAANVGRSLGDRRVTLIMNVLPGQEPGSGPNYYAFDDNVLYVLHVDNDRDGIAED